MPLVLLFCRMRHPANVGGKSSCHFCRISVVIQGFTVESWSYKFELWQIILTYVIPMSTSHKSGDANHIHFCRIQCPTHTIVVQVYIKWKRNPVCRWWTVPHGLSNKKILVGTTQLWPQQQVTMMVATRAAAIRMAEIQTDNDDWWCHWQSRDNYDNNLKPSRMDNQLVATAAATASSASMQCLVDSDNNSIRQCC